MYNLKALIRFQNVQDVTYSILSLNMRFSFNKFFLSGSDFTRGLDPNSFFFRGPDADLVNHIRCVQEFFSLATWNDPPVTAENAG